MTSAEVEKMVPGKAEVVGPSEAGRFDILWENGARGAFKIEGDTVNWLKLEARGKGIYEPLWDAVIPFFKKHGVKKIIAYYNDEASKKALKAYGPFKARNKRLEAKL